MQIKKNTIEETEEIMSNMSFFEPVIKKAPSKMSATSKLVLWISVLVFLGSFAYLLHWYIDRSSNISMNNELQSQVSDESQNNLYNFEELKSINPDFVGWINVPNTNVSLPVVQCADNSFYLKHDFYKKYDQRGTVFVDYRNNLNNFDANTILYGHNCYDGTMFSDLEKYQEIDFYKTTPVIEFTTENSVNYWKVYAVFVTSASASEDNGYIFNYIYPFMDGNNFTGFINEVNKRRLYVTNVDITDDDNMLVLSTCVRSLDLWKNGKRSYRANARLVIVARLLRNGESMSVNTENVTLNPSPKYPQLWYTKKGIKNPYINDEKWYPKEVVNK